MSRLVFWIGLAILIVFALRSKLRAAARRADDAAPRRPSAPAPRAAIEDMTRCAHCGLHFPASEAVRADGLDYCSPSHVRLPPH